MQGGVAWKNSIAKHTKKNLFEQDAEEQRCGFPEAKFIRNQTPEKTFRLFAAIAYMYHDKRRHIFTVGVGKSTGKFEPTSNT